MCKNKTKCQSKFLFHKFFCCQHRINPSPYGPSVQQRICGLMVYQQTLEIDLFLSYKLNCCCMFLLILSVDQFNCFFGCFYFEEHITRIKEFCSNFGFAGLEWESVEQVDHSKYFNISLPYSKHRSKFRQLLS